MSITIDQLMAQLGVDSVKAIPQIEKASASANGDCDLVPGAVVCASMSPVFSVGDVGKDIKIGAEQRYITAFVSATTVEYSGALITGTGYDVSVFGAALRVVAILRDPQPWEEGIPRESTVEVTAVDLDADPSDTTPPPLTVKMWIDQGAGEVEAFDGTSFAAPWNGPGSVKTENVVKANSSPDGDCDAAPGKVTCATMTPPFDSLDVDRLIRIGSELRHIVSVTNGTTVVYSGALITGTGLNVVAHDPFRFVKVVCDQSPALMPSEQVVTVRLSAQAGAGFGYAPFGHYPFGHHPSTEGTEHSYSFTVEDVTPPRLLSAEARGQFTIRATFNEAMATSGTGSILEASNWSITRHNVDPNPAVSLEVVSGAAVGNPSALEVDLTTHWEMTPGAPYKLAASGVEDISGNVVDPSYAEVDFVGFQPEVPENRRFRIYENMMPAEDRRRDEFGTQDLLRFTNCIQEMLDLLLYDSDHITDQWDPDLANATQVAWMLYDCGNPFDWYELELDETQQRKLLRLLVPIYRQKGTAVGIQNVIRLLLGLESKVLIHNATGWLLGEDILGDGEPAYITSGNAEPFDMSGGKTLNLQIDFESPVAIDFEDTDFVDPANATAVEVAAVLDADLKAADLGTASSAAGRVSVHSTGGLLAAMLADTAYYPVAIDPGQTLLVRVGTGIEQTVTFAGTETSVSDVASAIDSQVLGATTSVVDGHAQIATNLLGLNARLEVTGGTANAILGYSTTPVVGRGGTMISPESRVEILGGDANDQLAFSTEPEYAVRGAELGPSSARVRYTFDIEVYQVLTDSQLAVISKIANYMKAAHEHLGNILEPIAPDVPDHWELGESELGTETLLHE